MRGIHNHVRGFESNDGVIAESLAVDGKNGLPDLHPAGTKAAWAGSTDHRTASKLPEDHALLRGGAFIEWENLGNLGLPANLIHCICFSYTFCIQL